MRKILLAAAIVTGLGLVVPVEARSGNPGPIPTGDETEGTSEASDCGNGNSLIAVHPSLLWPPNHKYYGDAPNEELYFLATDDDGGQVALTTTGTHNQYDGDGAELNGSGNTGDEDGDGIGDDVRPWDDGGALDTTESTSTAPVYGESGEGSVQTDWAARSERAGTGVQAGVPNRVYRLTGMATFDDGECSLTIQITVPHDMGVGDGNGKKEPVR